MSDSTYVVFDGNEAFRCGPTPASVLEWLTRFSRIQNIVAVEVAEQDGDLVKFEVIARMKGNNTISIEELDFPNDRLLKASQREFIQYAAGWRAGLRGWLPTKEYMGNTLFARGARHAIMQKSGIVVVVRNHITSTRRFHPVPTEIDAFLKCLQYQDYESSTGLITEEHTEVHADSKPLHIAITKPDLGSPKVISLEEIHQCLFHFQGSRWCPKNGRSHHLYEVSAYQTDHTYRDSIHMSQKDLDDVCREVDSKTYWKRLF